MTQEKLLAIGMIVGGVVLNGIAGGYLASLIGWEKAVGILLLIFLGFNCAVLGSRAYATATRWARYDAEEKMK